jgi:aldose 1-epimerase
MKLTNGALELALLPEVGGAIAWFDWISAGARTPILRKTSDVPAAVLETASFPLVPYVNRIRGGEFKFRGRAVQLQANMAGDPSPLHGRGWLAEWVVQQADSRSAELSFNYAPGEWPWAYEARQRFELDPEGLSVALSCRNLADEPMPCGLGQHPYFFCSGSTRLDTRVTHAWTIDEHVLPVDKVAAEGRFDLTERAVCGLDLDHGFAGWSGSARMTDPAWPFEIEMSSSNANCFQLYSPPTGGIFVAEPVTHANAALNAPEDQWPELGMRVLEPGEEMRLDMRLGVRAV